MSGTPRIILPCIVFASFQVFETSIEIERPKYLRAPEVAEILLALITCMIALLKLLF